MRDPPQPEDWESRTRSLRDAATVIPYAAALLLLPPVILVFSAPLSLAGVPLIVVYLYAVWAGVILAAFLVAHRLEREGRDRGQMPPAADEPD